MGLLASVLALAGLLQRRRFSRRYVSRQ